MCVCVCVCEGQLQNAEKDDGTRCSLGKVEMKVESGQGKGCEVRVWKIGQDDLSGVQESSRLGISSLEFDSWHEIQC